MGPAAEFEAALLVDKLKAVREQLKQVADQMEDICEQFADYGYLLSIPGFGAYVSARVLASIANPWRFDSSSQVLKMAGYDLGANRSGKSSQRAVPVISKRGNAELRYALAVRQFADRRVGDLVRAGLIAVDGRTTVSEAAEHSVADPIADFLVTAAGRPGGYLSAPRLWARVRSDEPGTMPVAAIAEPLAPMISAQETVEGAIARFDPAGPGVAPVAGPDGTVIGVVAVGDLMRAAQLARHATRD